MSVSTPGEDDELPGNFAV